MVELTDSSRCTAALKTLAPRQGGTGSSRAQQRCVDFDTRLKEPGFTQDLEMTLLPEHSVLQKQTRDQLRHSWTWFTHSSHNEPKSIEQKKRRRRHCYFSPQNSAKLVNCFGNIKRKFVGTAVSLRPAQTASSFAALSRVRLQMNLRIAGRRAAMA